MPNTTPINLSGKKILLAPLDWGLGHASRCVPLLNQLQQQNNQLIVACTTQQKKFLEQELKGLEFIDLFGYNIRYARVLPLWVKIFLQLPKLCLVVRKERKWLAAYLEENKIDVVISDNRFGLYNSHVESIFITHQLNIQVPAFKNIVNGINTFFIKKYTRCWVPDYREKEKRLSGILSQENPNLKNVEFIGPLSRFEKKELQEKKYAVLLLLSGPEPQRSLLEEKLTTAFLNTQHTVALVRGSLQTKEKKFPSNFFVTDMASSKELRTLFASSEKIICRSGYSTLLDLHVLGLKALLIPTPGQTEQEYLARHWHKEFNYECIEQNKISKEGIEFFMNL